MSFVLYLCFIVSFFLHLTARIPALGSLRLDLILMILTVISMALTKIQSFRISESKPARTLTVFVIYVIVAIPLVEYPGSVIYFGLENFAKVVPFFFFTIYLVDTERKLKVLVGVFLLCQVIRTLEPLYLHVTEGYWGSVAYSASGGDGSALMRLASSPMDVLNPTQFGWLIISHLIFIYYLLWNGSRIKKLVFLCYAPLALYAFLLTGARSGMICLFFVVLQVIWFAENRKKAVIFGLILLVPIVIIAGAKMGPALQTRYLSIVKKDVAGSDTAMGRINGLKNNIRNVMNRPLFGHGIGTTREVNYNTIGTAQITHNMYFEIMQETGGVGFCVFFMYIKSLLSVLYSLRRRLLGQRPRTNMISLATALIVWMQMHLLYTLSCFSLNRWEWYLTGGMAVVCGRLAVTRSDESIVAPDENSTCNAQMVPATK